MIATGSTPAEARRGTSESLETALPPDRIEVIGPARLLTATTVAATPHLGDLAPDG
jgi:hypothetical protein